MGIRVGLTLRLSSAVSLNLERDQNFAAGHPASNVGDLMPWTAVA